MEASLTQLLAIWGAITGTIGTIAGIANLMLRLKQHKKDQPKLDCSSSFSFEHSSGEVLPKHKLIARSVGNRPVTVDFIRYYVKPNGFWQNLFKEKTWKTERYIYDDKLRNALQISEGKKEEFKISMPNGLAITDIIKVKIHDQSGKAWHVKWPSHRRLAVLIHSEHIHASEESNESRICKISGYSAAGSYYIYTHWNPVPGSKNAFTGRSFYLKNRKEFDEKLKNINEMQRPKILTCEINEIT